MLDMHSPAIWRVADLQNDRSWIFALDDAMRGHLARAVKAAFRPERPLLDYARKDIDLGATAPVIAAATLVVTLCYVVMNLIIDFAQAMVDPRVALS